jgi:NAD(P)H-hydrate repair Nnr-like enzyme with NAD(P)H-hydrate dehydratase domain
MMPILAGLAAVLAGAGLAEVLIASRLVAAFARARRHAVLAATGDGAETAARR